MPRPFAVIGFTLFLIFALLADRNVEAACVVAAIILPALIASLLSKKLRQARAVPSAFAAGAVACVLFIAAFEFDIKPAQTYSGEQHEIVAVLTDTRTQKYGRSYYDATVLSVDGNAHKFKTRLSFGADLDAQAYDKVSGTFEFYIPSEETQAYSRSKGIYAAAFSVDDAVVTPVDEGDKPLAYTFYELRCKIKDAVYDMLPNEYGGLIIALLIGDKGGLSPALLSAFRKVGISHIVCVSGLHLSVWALFALKLARKLKFSIKLASAISAAFTLLFMALTGFPLSVVRAGIMTLLFLLANLLMREPDSLNSLGFAVTVILLLNPFAAGDISLQLSFLSTLGIVLGYRKLSPYIGNQCKKITFKPLGTVAKYALFTLSSTLCAVAFTLPVTVELVGNINFICFPSNIISIFPATVCMVCAGAAVLLSFLPLAAGVAGVAMVPAGVAARFVVRSAERLSEYDRFIAYFDPMLSRLWLGLVLVLIAVSVVIFWKSGKARPLLTCALCAATFFSMVAASNVFYADIAEIAVIDVGNGSAVLISRGRKAALLGCGGDDFNASSDIIYALRDRSIDSVELLLLPQNLSTETACTLDFLLNVDAKAVACSELPMGCELIVDKSKTVPASFASSEVMEGVYIKSVCAGDYCYAVVDIGSSRALISFCPGSDILECDRKADVLIGRSDVPRCLDAAEYDIFVVTGSSKALLTESDLLSCGVNACATGGSGNIILRTSGDGLFAAYREE